MNANIRNQITHEPLASESSQLKTPALEADRLREASRGRRPRKNHQLWVTLGLAVSLVACGDDSGSQSVTGQASTGPKPTAESLASSSHTTCASSPLKGSWRSYDGFGDQIMIDEHCVFTTYYCESIGYIDTAAPTELGQVQAVIVWEGKANAGCKGPGTYQCAYDTRNAYRQELHFACH